MSKKNRPANRRNFFETFATKVTKATGSTPVFVSAFGIIILWAISGPFFGYSETWQLIINTGTTIITFLMVFLIQKTQNKDSLAIQLKLNELVASSRFASNRLVDVEDLTEEEMETLKKYYILLSDLSEKEDSLIISHSIDEAQLNHSEKRRGAKSKSNTAKPQKPAILKPVPHTSEVLEKTDMDSAAKPKPKPKRRKPKPKPKTDD